MKKDLRFLIFLTVFASIAVLAIGASQPYLSQYGPAVVNWGNGAKYGGTLKMLTSQNPLTLDFNPFITSSSLPVGFIYEPLFFDNLNGDVTNILASSYRWEDHNLELAVTVRKNVEWSDGTPFTAKDVAFTFNYLKANPAIDINGIWSKSNGLESVSATGGTVVFKFSQPNVPIFYYLANVFIVPQHIWSKVSDPAKFENPDPIGTGPFLFEKFNAPTNTVTFVKNKNYWMPGRPYLNGIIYKAVSSDNVSLLEMIKHNYDYAGFNVTNISKLYVNKDPSVNKVWYPILGNFYIVPNDAKYPFSIPAFRKAISMAMNRKMMWSVGGNRHINPYESNYDNPTMIPYPQQFWIPETLTSLAASLVSYNPQAAQNLLSSIGFKKDANGWLTGPDGKELPEYKFLAVQGWVAPLSAAKIFVQNLKAIGLKVSIDLASFGSFYSSVQTGNFDLSYMWENYGPTPYYTYHSLFSPNLTAPIGKTALSNFSRYTNPLITSALEIYKSTSDKELQSQAMQTVESVVLDDLPILPFLANQGNQVYSTENFVGWPSESIPYAYQMAGNNVAGEMAVLNVHSK